MKLFITGAAGFIGKYAVAAAKARGWEVCEWDQKRQGRIQDLTSWQLNGHTHILHLAGYSSNDGFAERLGDNYANNTMGLLNILNLAQRSGARVVYASSSAVYGACDWGENGSQYVNIEDGSCELAVLSSHYAKSKIINEMMAASFPNTLGLRIFNAYGAGDELKPPGKQAPPTWMRLAKERGEPIVIYGDGTQAKDFIHVSDVVEIVMRLIESDYDAATGIVNVGTGVATSFNALAKIIGGPRCMCCDKGGIDETDWTGSVRSRDCTDCHGTGYMPSSIEYREIPDPASYQFFTRADTTRLLSIIGSYKFKTLEEGLKELLSPVTYPAKLANIL